MLKAYAIGFFGCPQAVLLVAGVWFVTKPGVEPGLVWGDTVYTSKQEFNGYLKAKGLSYGAWLERNPGVAPWEPGGPHDQASPSPPQSIENWLSGFPLPPIVGLLAISAALLLFESANPLGR